MKTWRLAFISKWERMWKIFCRFLPLISSQCSGPGTMDRNDPLEMVGWTFLIRSVNHKTHWALHILWHISMKLSWRSRICLGKHYNQKHKTFTSWLHTNSKNLRENIHIISKKLASLWTVNVPWFGVAGGGGGGRRSRSSAARLQILT